MADDQNNEEPGTGGGNDQGAGTGGGNDQGAGTGGGNDQGAGTGGGNDQGAGAGGSSGQGAGTQQTPEDKEKIKKEKDARIKELKAIIAKKQGELKTADEMLGLCKHMDALKRDAKSRAEQCAREQNLAAELTGFQTEFDANAGEQFQVLNSIRNICGLDALPKLEFTCEPVPLPQLGTPEPGKLGDLPEHIKKSALPPIVWHHKNVCLESADPIALPKPQEEAEKAEIDNLRRACMVFKQSYATRVCDLQPQDLKSAKPEEEDDAAGSENNQKKKIQEEYEKLMALLSQLKYEIQSAKATTQNGRRRIIELCLELKQREAAIVECSEMLCHIMDERRGASDLLLSWQLSKLARYVEYLRWYLIRLNYEKEAQNSEIAKLEESLKGQNMMLLECLETKRRLCDAQKEHRNTSMNFDVCSWDI